RALWTFVLGNCKRAHKFPPSMLQRANVGLNETKTGTWRATRTIGTRPGLVHIRLKNKEKMARSRNWHRLCKEPWQSAINADRWRAATPANPTTATLLDRIPKQGPGRMLFARKDAARPNERGSQGAGLWTMRSQPRSPNRWSRAAATS